MEMKIKFFTLILFLGISTITFGQKTKFILPGQTMSITSKNDTLCVIGIKNYKKAIIVSKQLKICNEKFKDQQKIIDTLKQIKTEQQVLIDTLKKDRDFYRNNWQKAEENLKLLADMNKNQSRYTRIAIIAGATTTVVAFLAGIYIGL